MGKHPSKKGIVVNLPTIESTFVTVTGRGPQGWFHPDNPAMYVAIQILNADEGFFWVSRPLFVAYTDLRLPTEIYPGFWVSLWGYFLLRSSERSCHLRFIPSKSRSVCSRNVSDSVLQ